MAGPPRLLAWFDNMLDCVELQPPRQATASIIWLHGLGANGHDFVPIVPELGLGEQHGIRFIFPHAPPRPVTINGGMRMPAWYDIADPDIAAQPDQPGIETSSHQIAALIQNEITRGILSENIVLAGFSQGGAIALHAGLRQPVPLAGIMALSTYLPLQHRLEQEQAPANYGISIFMAHGEADPIVPITLGRTSRDCLTRAGYGVEWNEYPMAHEVCLPEIVAIGHWLRNRPGLNT